MKKSRIFPVLFQFFLFVDACYPRTIGAEPIKNVSLSLSKAQQLAIQRSPLIKEAQAEYGESAAKYETADSRFFPQLSAHSVLVGSTPNARIAATDGLNNPSIIERQSIGIEISQLLTDFGRSNALLQQAKFDELAQQSRIEQSRQDALFSVTTSYLEALKAQKLVDIARLVERDQEEALEKITQLVNANLRSSVDQGFADVAYGSAQLNRENAEMVSRQKRLELAVQIGADSNAIGSLEEPREKQYALSELLSHSNTDNLPLVRSLKDAIRGFQSAEKAARKSYLPELSLRGATGVTTWDQRDSMDTTYGVAGVVLSVPLLTGGRIDAEIQETQSQVQKYTARLDQLTDKMQVAIGTAAESLKVASEQVKAATTVSESAARALALSKSRYESGLGSILEFNQAQTQAQKAENDLVNARYDYLERITDLLYQEGLLQIGDT